MKERRAVFARAYNPDRLILSDSLGKTLADEPFSLSHALDAGAYDLFYTSRSATELTSADALAKTLGMFVRPFSPRSWRSGRVPVRERLQPPRILSLTFAAASNERSAPEELDATTDTVMTSMVAAPSTERSPSIPEPVRLAAERLANIDEHAMSGRIDLALADVREARKLYPNVTIDWATWNQLCWHAAIRNDAAAVVHETCEYAASLAPDDPSVRGQQGRGERPNCNC